MKLQLSNSLLRNKKTKKEKPTKASNLYEAKIKLAEDRSVSAEKGTHSFQLNFGYKFPPRIPFNEKYAASYGELERRVFMEWSGRQNGMHEQNLETWRQFWIVCERSDVIVQVVDARDPLFYVIDDLIAIYGNKRHVIFVNKIDLLQNRKYEDSKEKIELTDLFAKKNYETVFYSTKTDSKPIHDFIKSCDGKTIGFVGFPNVGKSSTINKIIGVKKVCVSSTPGKTKHMQSYDLEHKTTILDCPGLVFAGAEKIKLLLYGIVNANHFFEYKKYFNEVVDFVGVETVKKEYGHVRGEYELFKRLLNDLFLGSKNKQN